MSRWFVVILVCLAAQLGMPPALAAPANGVFLSSTYTNASGTLTYKVFIPRRLTAHAPLVVALHGAGETADTHSTRSQWNQVAAREGFLVVYPEQNPSYNGGRQWSWAEAAKTGREHREASLIAGITAQVSTQYRADLGRRFVMGISAGAGMATVMATLYPELYSAVGSYAGCQFDGARCGGTTVTAEDSGALAFRTMGAGAHRMPTFVVYGDVDPVALAVDSAQVVDQWLITNDWADNGLRDNSVPAEPASTRSGTVPGGHSYDVTGYVDGDGYPLIEHWVVHGMGHAWSSGEPASVLPYDAAVDPLGPDVTTAAYEFFLRSTDVLPGRRT